MADAFQRVFLQALHAYLRDSGHDPISINGGDCSKFAQEVWFICVAQGIDCELVQVEEETDFDSEVYGDLHHCVVWHEGLFYDSLSPHGVEHWGALKSMSLLSFVHRHGAGVASDIQDLLQQPT